MKGFVKLDARAQRLWALHASLRQRLLVALVQRQQAAAREMIGIQLLAALDPAGADTARHRVRSLRLQADGIELGQSANTRAAFLLRQIRRIERRLDGHR